VVLLITGIVLMVGVVTLIGCVTKRQLDKMIREGEMEALQTGNRSSQQAEWSEVEMGPVKKVGRNDV
jgi:hypothetical protein